MSVDTSSIENAVRAYAQDVMQCAADTFVETAQGLAPHATGELAGSIEHSGVSDSGTSATATVTVGAPYATYVEHGRGGESGLLAIQVGGEVVIVESVGPAQAQPFFGPTVDQWGSIIGGCG